MRDVSLRKVESMDRRAKRFWEELNDLYIEKVRQVDIAIQTGKSERVAKILSQYQSDRQRIVDDFTEECECGCE